MLVVSGIFFGQTETQFCALPQTWMPPSSMRASSRSPALFLPVGWVLIGVFYALGEPIVDALPAPHRQALLPVCRAPSQLWFAVPLSLLIGSATHVFWDSFTHETGWFVERSSFLQMKLFSHDGHSFRVYRLLWHLSTWMGLFLLYRVYASVLKKSPGAANSLFQP